jgi:hypothetical protein
VSPGSTSAIGTWFRLASRNVLRFDVAVDDAFGVRVVERVRHLANDSAGIID